jgi:uncharacterized membrane protein
MGMTSAIQLAAIRPNEWELPLFIHVLGALALTGAFTLTAIYLFSTWRSGSADTLRLAVRSLTLGVFPSWIVLRVSAEWISDKEGYADLEEPPNWIDVGYIVSDLGFLLIVISSVLSYLALRKARAGGDGPWNTARVAAVLVALLIVMNVIAVWAMTTKPA